MIHAEICYAVCADDYLLARLRSSSSRMILRRRRWWGTCPWPLTPGPWRVRRAGALKARVAQPRGLSAGTIVQAG